eukprot:6714223-Alexandrium_andersonii.AAC.1
MQTHRAALVAQCTRRSASARGRGPRPTGQPKRRPGRRRRRPRGPPGTTERAAHGACRKDAPSDRPT